MKKFIPIIIVLLICCFWIYEIRQTNAKFPRKNISIKASPLNLSGSKPWVAKRKANAAQQQ